MILLWVLIGIIIIQRLVELLVAKRNEKWMLNQGGYEVEGEHYKWIVLVHVLFFVSLITEVLVKGTPVVTWSQFLIGIFLLTQVTRVWCLSSLGKYWNTKIIVLPGADLVSKGPYRFIKHPNYWIVGIEFVVIPLIFGAYITAAIFPFLHLALMRVRIPKEERALLEISKIRL